MPEYLSPGVFIEEVPARLKAIEGVSTSTAGFVGPAERGPVAGFGPPYTPTGDIPVPADPAPVLVTSFAEYTRQFGNPLPLPKPTDSKDSGYLAHAVRAFFNNGGKRCYVARVAHLATAGRAAARLHQGNVLRLARPARQGATEVFLSSVRGLNKGATLRVLKRSDGTSAVAGEPAVIKGTAAAPFQLAPGDRFAVAVGGGATVTMTAVQATPASKETTSDGPFATLADNDTLEVQVGPGTPPVQKVTFKAADFTAGAATAAEVAAILNADLTGVQAVVTGGNKVTVRSDQLGKKARIAFVGGTALTKLGFAGPVAKPSDDNVDDAAAVTIPEIVALMATAGFSLVDDGTGKLVLTSATTGPAASLTIQDTQAGTAKKLGLVDAADAPLTATGKLAATIAVADYATRSGRVTLGEALPNDLDPAEVYLLAAADPTPAGPKFFARSPGIWGGNVSVRINPSARTPPTRVTVAAAAADSAIAVESASSFYPGAVVEVDHGASFGSVQTRHEVKEVKGNVVLLAEDDTLTQPVDANSLVRVLEVDVAIDDASGAAPTETYTGLSWNRSGKYADLRRHYATQVNIRSRLVYVQPPGYGNNPALSGDELPDLASQPCTADGFPVRLQGGDDGLPARDNSGDDDYIGKDDGPGQRTGIQSLADVDDVRIIAAPGRTSAGVQLELIGQCERLRYRFAVLDGELPGSDPSVTTILTHRNLYDSSFAAYYVPWVEVTIGDQTVYLPPSGHVAGVYARTDTERGVHKAPANEVVRAVTGLQAYITTGEQDVLNPRGVNALRRFEGRGIRVWGARTLSSNPEFRYVNVRRFLIFLEASIDRGTQYVVFEPNSPETWGRVVDSVSAFLHTQWRTGALFGRRPEDAFFVRCDEGTMTADDVQNGRLICNIGVAIVRPAEFVIFRIEQITGFASQA